MTRDEVLAMKPGRELDALVAEKVMGWKSNWLKTDWWEEINPNTHHHKGLVKDFKPSTDISAAWEVVQEMRKKGFDFALETLNDSLKYHARFFRRYEGDYGEIDSDISEADAICKAALLAVIGE